MDEYSGAERATSLVELVVEACEWSDDPQEIAAWIDGLADRGEVVLTAPQRLADG